MSTLANWAGIAKQRYGNFINPMPSENTIAEAAPFVSAERRGGVQFNFPIMLGLEGGVTHDNTNTAFTLNSTVDSVTANAALDGSTIAIAGNLPYDVIAKFMAPGATVDDKRAVDFKVNSLMQAGELYRELALLYGPGSSAALSNLGVVSASISGANIGANQIVNFTRVTWAPGVWNQMVNQLVDIYQSDGSTLRESDVKVVAITDGTKNRVKFFKTGSVATIATGDMVIARGACTKSCYGLQAQLENTGSLFGIDASVYPQWKSASFSAGTAALTTAKIRQMAARLYPNGLMCGGDLFVCGNAFADVADELTQLQRYTGNTDGTKRTGAEAIEILSPIGTINVKVHRFMKQGIAMFLPRGGVKRVGASDLTFSLPGGGPEFFIQSLPSNLGLQLRIYAQQAPLIEIPYHAAEITGIASTADTTPS